MEFIKNFIVGAAKFAYNIMVAPIFEARKIFSKATTWGQKLIKLIDAGSRVVIIASWFFVLPALLVTLAWIWFWVTVVIAMIYVTIVMLSSSAGLAFLLLAANRLQKSQTEQSEAVTPVAA